MQFFLEKIIPIGIIIGGKAKNSGEKMQIFDTCRLRVRSLYSNYFSINKCKAVAKYMG